MKTKRRNFLKLTGIAGLSIFSRGIVKGYASESENPDKSDIPQLNKYYKKTHKQRFNMSGYAAPKIDNVRIGIIGLGQRGPAHMWCISRIEGADHYGEQIYKIGRITTRTGKVVLK